MLLGECRHSNQRSRYRPTPILRSVSRSVRYYRTSSASADLRRCRDYGNTSGCVGGVGGAEGPCKPGLEGPYCSVCTVRDTSHYYSSDESACLRCEGDVLWPLRIGLGGAVALLGLVGLVWRCRGRTPRRLQAVLRSAWKFYAQLSLRAKFKQMLSFYQVVSRISEVYEVQLPAKVQQLIAIFDIVNINIDSLGLPLQCLGLGDYEVSSVVSIVWSVVCK